jgi:hypothetical protein
LLIQMGDKSKERLIALRKSFASDLQPAEF